VLTGLTVAIATTIATGMVLLWPGELERSNSADVLRRGEIVRARVSSIEIAPCGSTTGAAGGQGAAPSPAPGAPSCRGIALFVREGPDQGTRVRLELPDIPSSPDLAVDEEVLLERPPAEIPGVPYGFYDRIRSPSLLWLALVFGGLVVLLGRLRGLAALVGLAVSVVILLAFVIGFQLLTTRTTFGRHLFAVGGNAEAARRAGIRVDGIRVVAFTLCSSMAAVGGIMAASRLLAVNQSSGGSDLLLLAIAGPVIAGTSLFGGRGSVWSALLGAIVIGSISNGMDLLALESSVKFMVTGGVLLAAVVVDAIARSQRQAAGRV